MSRSAAAWLAALIACGALMRAPGLAQQAAPPPPATGQTPPAGRGSAPVQGAEPDIPLVARFDRNGDNRLDYAERTAAREYLTAHPELRRPVRVGARSTRTGTPGPALTPKDVKAFPAAVPLYDAGTLRTLFLTFENADWEQELAVFYHTDVHVPATLIVDGKTYRDVGVSFRGNNSFTAVPEGLKRPLSITMDAVHDQTLLGHRSLNLLNANQDPTFLRSVLYLDIARDYIPAVKANFARVAINGESWGIYVNQQTFSREFEREAFKTSSGTRWKSPNNSVGGGFGYLGDDIALYRRWYEMKGGDNPAAWKALIHVTKVLNETPPEKLEGALAPIMDVDEVLWFLALDVALVNNDGYWRDGSDFNVYLNDKGRFLLTPHDANEGFRAGGRGGPGGVQPDPLTTLDDANKALRHKLLTVPTLRDRYLKYMGDIAGKWLDWRRLGPLVEKYRTLIAEDVARDTRKLDTTEAFRIGIYGPDAGTPPPATSLKGFADLRRAALLAHPDIARVAAQDMPADYKAVLSTLGRSGDFKDGVLKVNIPRADLKVTIGGRPAPTAFGFGGWLAMTKGDGGHEVMMGDLVLTEDEVNPVMSAVLNNGLDVTALHNHFLWEQPRVFYMHVHGTGTATDLAKRAKPAIDLIDQAMKRAAPSAPAAPASGTLDSAALAKIIGHPGEQSGPVYKITIGRPDIRMRQHGAVINARMGLNTWAAFAGTDADAMVAGDVAMLEHEVTPVLTALRTNGLNVVTLHHHMTGVQPVVIFLHYYGTGPAAKLAQGVRAALDVIGKAKQAADVDQRPPNVR